MTVAIVYGRVAEDAPEDEKDVLAQAQEIREALARLGHQTFDVPVSLDLQASAELLSRGGRRSPSTSRTPWKAGAT